MRVEYRKVCEAIAAGRLADVGKEVQANPKVVEHWKPLCDAAFYGSSECIGILLDAGADPNQIAGTASRHTPLTRIAQYHKTIPKHEGHSKSMSLLLNRGANPGISAGPLNLTPLAYATIGPLSTLVEVLRGHADGRDIFSAASLHDKYWLEQILDEQVVTPHVDESDRTPLHYIGLSGMWRELGASSSLECAKLLLDHSYEVDAVQEIPDEGEVFEATPLWYAVAYSQNVELIKFLLERRANPNPATFAATYSGELQIVQLLNQYGADWNIKFAGRTPIQDLLSYRRTKLVPWLLDNGARVDLQDSDGRTALHTAAMYGCKPNLLQQILDHGGDTNVKDNEGCTPLDLARKRGKTQVVDFLENV